MKKRTQLQVLVSFKGSGEDARGKWWYPEQAAVILSVTRYDLIRCIYTHEGRTHPRERMGWISMTPNCSLNRDFSSEPCAVMPPLEIFMEVSYEERRAMLYRDLERGDVVIGRINNIREYGFFLTLLCTSVGLKRDIEDLELSVGPARINPATDYAPCDKNGWI